MYINSPNVLQNLHPISIPPHQYHVSNLKSAYNTEPTAVSIHKQYTSFFTLYSHQQFLDCGR